MRRRSVQRHGQLGEEDNVAVPRSCPADCARMVGGHTTASGWEILESDVAEDYPTCVPDWVSAGVWDGGAVSSWGAGEAPRVCVKELEGGDAAARAGEGVRGDRVNEKATSGPAGWCAVTPTMVITLVP